MDSEFSSLQSLSDDFSDDTDLSALLPRRYGVYIPSEDGLSELETVSKGEKTRKRKTPVSSGRVLPSAKRPRTRKSTSASTWSARRGRSQPRFSPEETERWVEIVSDCKSEGLLRPNSRRLGSVWDNLVTAFAREFPDKKWTRETMEAKLATEKRRCDQFLAALTSLGPSYDDSEGADVVEDTERDAGKIVKHYPDTLRPQNKPLGDLHDDIFSQETFITGQEIDAITRTECSEEEDVTTDDEDWPGNQDLAIGNGSASATRHALPEIPLFSPASQRVLESTLATIAKSRMTAATQLSETEEYDYAVSLATKDMQARYAGKEGQPGKYSIETILSCLDNFVERPGSAVVWNALPEQLKDMRMAEWVSEIAEKPL